MRCEVLSSLYLRSNGDIPCWDDAGSNLQLAHIGENGTVAPEDTLSNHMYTHIREALAAGRMPWTNICSRCAMLRPNEPYVDSLSRRAIRMLQVEPTVACALACPGCSQHIDVRKRNKPLKMAPPTFENFLLNLAGRDFTVQMIEYCGNGEPLNHPQFRDFVTAARRHYPKVRQRVITNGNFDYTKVLGGVHVDQFMIACDGARQDSYEQYRRGGNLARVHRFMEDIPRHVDGQRQTKIWKYILFEFNDSEEELIQAQKMVPDLGLDQILFVVTHSAFASRRFTAHTIADLPIISGNVAVEYTPIHDTKRRVLRPCAPLAPEVEASGRSIIMLDEVSLASDGTLTASGWALAKTPIAQIRVYVDGEQVGSTQPRQMRLDVHDALPEFGSLSSGFSCRWHPGGLDRKLAVSLQIMTDDGPAQMTTHEFFRDPDADS